MSPDKLEVLAPSLLSTVPADIWRAIFKLCASRDTNPDPRYHLPSVTDRSPVLLCRVCSVWRTIATNAPELWNTVHVFIDFVGNSSLTRKILELFLERAGTLPLKITLDTSSPILSDAAEGVIDLLLHNFYRADYIAVEINLLQDIIMRRWGPLQLDEILSEGLPSLQTLVLRASKKSKPDACISKLWTLSPKLTKVVFHRSITFEWLHVVNTLQIPLAQLTALHILARIGVNDLHLLFSKFKNIVECTIGDLILTDGLITHEIFLPNLRCLGLTAKWNIIGFIRHLETPALTVLDMQDSGEDWQPGVFTSFIAKSRCSLKHFGVTVLDTNEKEKLDCFYLFPDLTSLTVYKSDINLKDTGTGYDFHYYLIEELGKWDRSKREFSVLPHLQQIEIDYEILGYGADTMLFANMVEDRWIRTKVTNLPEDYTVDSDDASIFKWAPNEILRLLILKRDGLDVELDPVPPIATEVFHLRRRLRG
ncbi:hypothetical protein GALMADRAFT_254055 [Galerina marginata CBS 339.88]|uniref:F-box domain-containing protein n=1 Tax=Galerina marginata (strain CBS 339.88) TaxID=685588 RepID=A0A067SWT9_GALM3|nr:hypothetical protein GALMADRAFT_254055 [Galerina marginata CBS 339.88]